MRLLPTIVCAVSALALTGCGHADEQPHAVIGAKTPNELTAQDVLDLPGEERNAWIHGGVVMIAQTSAYFPDSKPRCVMDWYFTLEGTHEVIVSAFISYPDERASSVLISLAGQACDTFEAP